MGHTRVLSYVETFMMISRMFVIFSPRSTDRLWRQQHDDVVCCRVDDEINLLTETRRRRKTLRATLVASMYTRHTMWIRRIHISGDQSAFSLRIHLPVRLLEGTGRSRRHHGQRSAKIAPCYLSVGGITCNRIALPFRIIVYLVERL